MLQTVKRKCYNPIEDTMKLSDMFEGGCNGRRSEEGR